MKSNLSIVTQVALTLTLFTSATASVDAKEATDYNAGAENPSISAAEGAEYEADIYLDTLDADGHLSILESETYTAKSHEQKVAVEPKVAAESKVAAEPKVATESKIVEAKVQKATTEAKYVEAKYSTTKAADTHKANIHSFENHIKVAAAPKAKPDAYGKEHGASDAHEKSHGKSDKSFLTKHTTEIEFTFAILVIVIGLIASERFQRVQEQQVETANEPSNQDFGLE